MADIRIVDDDTLLLGLDGFFRSGVKQVEADELLACVESVAGDLSLSPSSDPVEGYYNETPELERYFRLMRSLQGVEGVRESEILDTQSLHRLKQIVGSPIFGVGKSDRSKMLPRSMDVLADVLENLAPEWRLEEVLESAQRQVTSDDFSLVGMACRFGAPHVVVALRETVALYASMVGGSCSIEVPEYRWEVSGDLELLSNRFIETVARDIGFDIPSANSSNVIDYYQQAAKADVVGRCIAIGYNDAVLPIKYYHWAIGIVDHKITVEEFWDDEIWTTERYSSEYRRGYRESVDPSRPLCKQAGCSQHSVRFSLFCQKHHEKMLEDSK